MSTAEKEVSGQRVITSLEAILAALAEEREPSEQDVEIIVTAAFELLADFGGEPGMTDMVWYEEVYEVGSDDDQIETRANQILEEGAADWCVRSFGIASPDGSELWVAWLESWGHGMVAEASGTQLGLSEDSAIDALLVGRKAFFGQSRDEYDGGCLCAEQLAKFVDGNQ